MPTASRVVLAACLAVASAASSRADVVLYDPGSGQFPDGSSWGWAYSAQSDSNSSDARSIDAAAGRTTLDTTANNDIRAGYALTSPVLPSLDRAVGFTLSLGLQVLDEAHASADRAGFSLIVLTSDRRGIELGFWNDRVWAQAEGFTHAEEALFDTTAATAYDLAIQGNAYTLFADGSARLTGSLRDYSGSGMLPYILPNFVFLGDNTRSARGSIALGSVIYRPTAVPEPGAAMLVGIGLIGLVVRGRCRA